MKLNLIYEKDLNEVIVHFFNVHKGISHSNVSGGGDFIFFNMTSLLNVNTSLLLNPKPQYFNPNSQTLILQTPKPQTTIPRTSIT
jgi:hypothetical protein